MKFFANKSFRFFCIICALLCLTLIVNAHGGRTDAYGGHYDRSDGSYHYHHGYSEHRHYDMDGDGDIDCPYKFKYEIPYSSESSYDYDYEIYHSSDSSSSASNIKNDEKTEDEGFSFSSLDFYDVFKIIVYLIFAFFSAGTVLCILIDIFPDMHTVIQVILFVILIVFFFWLFYYGDFL